MITWYVKKALSPPPLTMPTGNLVNLEKTPEMAPIKDEFPGSYLKQTFGILDLRNWVTKPSYAKWCHALSY